MANTVKCFICKVPGTYDLRVCDDGRKHKICGSCYDLCQENYIVMLSTGIAQTIAAHETWITVKITDIDDISNVRYDVDLAVPTAELENKVQWFVSSVLTRFFDKDHNSPNVRIQVSTWQNFRFQCPVYNIDHMDMENGFKWYAEQYVKQYYTSWAVTSPSDKYGKVPMNEHGLYFQAKNMLENKKDMPYIKYYFDTVYIPFFVHCYNTAVENYRIYGTPEKAVNFSLASAPIKVCTEQGKEKAEQATEHTFVTFFLNGKVYRQAMFAENIAVQGGILVWNNGKHLLVKYEHIIKMQHVDDVTLYATSYDYYLEPGEGKIQPLSHGQKFDLRKSWAMSAKAGDIVTHWQGGEQVKSVFVSAHENYLKATSSYGGLETVGYIQVISIEPGNDHTPDSTPIDNAPIDDDTCYGPIETEQSTPDSELFVSLPPMQTAEQETPAYKVTLWHDGLILKDIEVSNENDAHDIARSNVGASYPVPTTDLYSVVNIASVYDSNGLIIGNYTLDGKNFTLPTAEQETPANNPLLPIPDDEAIEHTFKSRKSSTIAAKIRKNAFNRTSRIITLALIGFLACCFAGVLSTGTSHAQTNSTCKVYAYKHKAGYYEHTWQGTVSNLTSVPSGCTLVNSSTANNSSVVSTSTPSVSTSTVTPVSTVTPSTTSTHAHKKHASKKHHSASTQQSTDGCKYTFDDSDTGTHKRVCNGVSIVIKITD